ncbi:VOC family protein [Kiritimatiellaeota bacterium B1221]|nr:VOC family protein [Kiritimatiellaeota bacterium B1221]
MKVAPTTRTMLYVRDVQKLAAFYVKHFGFVESPREYDDFIEIKSPNGGSTLLFHQASKGHKIGQSCIKLIFDVEDIEAFKKKCKKDGLNFGVTHKGAGYEFSNARDPAKNPIQISQRAFRNE